MYKQIKYVAIIILIAAFCASCNEKVDNGKPYCFTLKDVPISKWKKLANKKIYFGHQSVGNNVLNGIRDLMTEYPQIRLNIVTTNEKADLKFGAFAHSRIGLTNGPEFALNFYSKVIDELLGGNADIALLRFSQNQIDANTNVENVFRNYKEFISLLKKKYPKTIFVHCTLPIMSSKTGWKTWIKKIVGKSEIWEYDANINLNRFNALLVRKYAGKEPVLDIAKLQSIFPDGQRSTFTKSGIRYYNMISEYTYDDVHLNEEGRKKAAEQMLLFLIALI